MYAILTSKPGQYHAAPDDGAAVVETYEYRFCGRIKALYQVVEVDANTRVVITEDAPPHIRNTVPAKFLEQFDTVAEARAELEHLVRFGNLDTRLDRVQ